MKVCKCVRPHPFKDQAYQQRQRTKSYYSIRQAQNTEAQPQIRCSFSHLFIWAKVYPIWIWMRRKRSTIRCSYLEHRPAIRIFCRPVNVELAIHRHHQRGSYRHSNENENEKKKHLYSLFSFCFWLVADRNTLKHKYITFCLSNASSPFIHSLTRSFVSVTLIQCVFAFNIFFSFCFIILVHPKRFSICGIVLLQHWFRFPFAFVSFFSIFHPYIVRQLCLSSLSLHTNRFSISNSIFFYFLPSSIFYNQSNFTSWICIFGID